MKDKSLVALGCHQQRDSVPEIVSVTSKWFNLFDFQTLKGSHELNTNPSIK